MKSQRCALQGRHPPPSCGTFLQAHPDMTLQHDNAISHTARSMRDFLQDKNVSVPAMASEDPGSQSH